MPNPHQGVNAISLRTGKVLPEPELTKKKTVSSKNEKGEAEAAAPTGENEKVESDPNPPAREYKQPLPFRIG